MLALQQVTSTDHIPARLTPVARSDKAYRAWLKARLKEYAAAMKEAKANKTRLPNVTDFTGAL